MVIECKDWQDNVSVAALLYVRLEIFKPELLNSKTKQPVNFMINVIHHPNVFILYFLQYIG